MTINNNTSGFSSTGLYPLDSSKILDKLKPSEPFYKPPTSPSIASILAIPTVSQTKSTNKNTSKLLKVTHARVLTDSALVEALKQNELEIKRKGEANEKNRKSEKETRETEREGSQEKESIKKWVKIKKTTLTLIRRRT
jgi:hypothetical protein